MVGGFFGFLKHGSREATGPRQRARHFFDTAPDHLYAIGDVHGCDDLLGALETKIYEDAAERSGSKWLVMLGDYVDRGPKSASVLDRLISHPAPGFSRFCLAGNHEDVMLDFLRHPAPDHRWLDFGGLETLYSYGIHKLPGNRQAIRNALMSYVPQEHIQFLEQLPSLISIPGYCLVHAGIRENVPLAEQDDATLLWTRPRADSSNVPKRDFIVVHGHTPVTNVDIDNGRVNLDTGAYVSGTLSAVRLSKMGRSAIIQCNR